MRGVLRAAAAACIGADVYTARLWCFGEGAGRGMELAVTH
jgi:hypothetical protein